MARPHVPNTCVSATVRYFTILALLVASLATASAKPPSQPGCGSAGQPPCPPVPLQFDIPSVASATPSLGSGDTSVTVTGSWLSKATSIMFGGIGSSFTVQDDHTIMTLAPLGGTPGSTVPVTAQRYSFMGASTATFSYPIADLSVTGPLPYDPNDIGDTAWYNGGGHSIEANPPATLMFGTAAPVFHVTAGFYDDSETHPESLTPPLALGNEGKYSATLQMCSLTGTPTKSDEGGVCANWDGNTGIWLDVDSQSLTLTGNGHPGALIFGDLALQTAGVFDVKNLARTFQIELSLQQADTNSDAASGNRQASKTSSPFTAIIAPTALIQLNTLPYTILYQPPGNQSTVSFSTTAAYGANFALGNSSETTNKTTFDGSNSTKFAMSAAYIAGITAGGSGSWDQASSTSLVTTNGSGSGGSANIGFTATWSSAIDAALVPGSGDTCGSPTNCSGSNIKHDPDIYSKEPFWKDTFVLMVHPQFATWVDGSGLDRFVIYAAVPVTVDVTVAQLAACAKGATLLGQDACVIDYSNDSLTAANGQPATYTGTASSLTLSPSEAAALLHLDPFYSGGQNAALPATRVIPVASVSYGAKVGQLPRPFAQTLTNQTQTQASNSTQEASTTSVVDVIGNDSTAGLTVNVSGEGASANESLVVTNAEKTTFQTDIKTSYSDSSAVSNQLTTTAQVVLNDVDNTTSGSGGSPTCKTCHDPLPDQPSVNIYLDRKFGSFMFQDPQAPRVFTPLDLQQLSENLIAILSDLELVVGRFPDVPSGNPARIAIGLLARAHIMRGIPEQGFDPEAALTRGQLALTLAAALKLPPAAGANPYSDLAPLRSDAPLVLAAAKAGLIVTPSPTVFGPNEAVSRQEIATSIARAFRLTKTSPTAVSDVRQIAPYAATSVSEVIAAGYMTVYPDGTFKPTASVTRADAALAVFGALKDRL